MLAVVVVLLTLLPSTDSSMEIFNKCSKPVANSPHFGNASFGTSSTAGDLCRLLRFEVGRCLAYKLKLKPDDGSLAGRGRILADMIARTGNNTQVVKTARFYHYGCVYNDRGLWLTRPKCFGHMVRNCVETDGDCYEMTCPKETSTAVPKQTTLKEETPASGGGALWMWTLGAVVVLGMY